jgi:hypothetical protein
MTRPAASLSARVIHLTHPVCQLFTCSELPYPRRWETAVLQTGHRPRAARRWRGVGLFVVGHYPCLTVEPRSRSALRATVGAASLDRIALVFSPS